MEIQIRIFVETGSMLNSLQAIVEGSKVHLPAPSCKLCTTKFAVSEMSVLQAHVQKLEVEKETFLVTSDDSVPQKLVLQNVVVQHMGPRLFQGAPFPEKQI
jgi:hypothetical protein